MNMRIMAVAALAAIAGASPAGAGVFSRTGPVIAILAGDLFVGEAKGNLDGSGTIALQSRTGPDVTCSGQFTSGAKLGYAGDLRCSDGSGATFQFQRLSLVKGYGSGNFSRGLLTFTYGLSPAESVPYLRLPPGKALKQNGTEVMLVSAAQPAG